MQRRFLIVEDHPLYAEALTTVIGAAMPDIRLIHVRTLAEALATIKSGVKIELALLDLWLPDTHGFEGLIEIRMLQPGLPILVNSAFDDADVVHNAVACGAAGFIAKTASSGLLMEAIRDVLAGNVPLPEKYQPPRPAEQPEVETLKNKLSALTQQQLRVLQMLCQGLLNKQIAYELGVGETTVKAHVSEILRKLGVCSRTQAVLGVSKVCAPTDFRPMSRIAQGSRIAAETNVVPFAKKGRPAS